MATKTTRATRNDGIYTGLDSILDKLGYKRSSGLKYHKPNGGPSTLSPENEAKAMAHNILVMNGKHPFDDPDIDDLRFGDPMIVSWCPLCRESGGQRDAKATAAYRKKAYAIIDV